MPAVTSAPPEPIRAVFQVLPPTASTLEDCPYNIGGVRLKDATYVAQKHISKSPQGFAYEIENSIQTTRAAACPPELSN